MGHNARIRTDLGWLGGFFLPAELKALDDKTVDSWNGDDGFTHSLGSTVIIGGAGMKAIVQWYVSGVSAVAKTLAGSGKRIIHADGDFTLLKAGNAYQSRSIRAPAADLVNISTGTYRWILNTIDGSMRPTGFMPGGPWPGACGLLDLPVHHFAVLDHVAFGFIGFPGTPSMFPRFRVYKMDAKNVLTPLNTASSTLAGGYLAPTAATWSSSGTYQQFTYPIDAGTRIDTSQFRYVAEVQDWNNLTSFQNVLAAHTNVLDLRPG